MLSMMLLLSRSCFCLAPLRHISARISLSASGYAIFFRHISLPAAAFSLYAGIFITAF
jgi:hypothetical protein